MRTATFYASGSFVLRERRLFVIVGDVLEGEVRAGMKLSVPLGGIALTTRVASVEFVDVIHERKAYLGLAIECADPDELDFWMALGISGETLTLESEP